MQGGPCTTLHGRGQAACRRPPRPGLGALPTPTAICRPRAQQRRRCLLIRNAAPSHASTSVLTQLADAAPLLASVLSQLHAVGVVCKVQAAAAMQLVGNPVQELLRAVRAAVGFLVAGVHHWAHRLSVIVNTAVSSYWPALQPQQQQQQTRQQTAAAAEKRLALTSDALPATKRCSRVEGIRPSYPPDVLMQMEFGQDRNLLSSSSYLTYSQSSMARPHQQHPTVVATRVPHPQHQAARTWFNRASDDKHTDELGFAVGASSEATEDLQAWRAMQALEQQCWAQRAELQQHGQRRQQPSVAYAQQVPAQHMESPRSMLPQLGLMQVAVLAGVGWLAWRVTRRLLVLADDRKQQKVVAQQLLSQEDAEALADQRARFRRALAPKDAAGATSARSAAMAAAAAADEATSASPTGVLPVRSSSPMLGGLTMNEADQREYQRFLQSSKLLEVGQDAIWYPNKTQDYPKVSSEVLTRMTQNIRDAVKNEDLEREQQKDKAALRELLQQDEEPQEDEEGADMGVGWQGRASPSNTTGSSGRSSHMAAEADGDANGRPVDEGAWADALQQIRKQREQREASSPKGRGSPQQRSGSRSGSRSRSGSPDDGFNPFALTTEARQKWDADDHLYTTPKAKGLDWGKKAGSKGAKKGAQQQQQQQPSKRGGLLADAQYEFSLARRQTAAGNSDGSSSSSDGNKQSSGATDSNGQVAAANADDPAAAFASSSSSSSGASSRRKQPAGTTVPSSVAAAAAEEDLNTVLAELPSPPAIQARGRRAPSDDQDMNDRQQKAQPHSATKE